MENLEKARAVVELFERLVAHLPVKVWTGTVFVTKETPVPYGVFAMVMPGVKYGLIPIQFELDNGVEEIAEYLASEVERQKPWLRPTDSEP